MPTPFLSTYIQPGDSLISGTSRHSPCLGYSTSTSPDPLPGAFLTSLVDIWQRDDLPSLDAVQVLHGRSL